MKFSGYLSLTFFKNSSYFLSDSWIFFNFSKSTLSFSFFLSKLISSYFDKNSDILEIGIDEAGKGPMFGRVYSAAVILPKENFDFTLLKDSKKFKKKKKILEVYNYIKSNCINYSISYKSENIIDNISRYLEKLSNAKFLQQCGCDKEPLKLKWSDNTASKYILINDLL